MLEAFLVQSTKGISPLRLTPLPAPLFYPANPCQPGLAPRGPGGRRRCGRGEGGEGYALVEGWGGGGTRRVQLVRGGGRDVSS